MNDRNMTTTCKIISVAPLLACLALTDGVGVPPTQALEASASPVSLSLRGNWDSPTGEVALLRVAPPRVFLKLGADTLSILDVRDPAHPLEMGRYQAAEPVVGVELDGDLACVAEQGGPAATNGVLEILDVGNASNPARLGRVAVAGLPIQVAFRNGTAFVAERFGPWPDGNSVMEVFSLTNPSSPVLVGWFDAEGYIHDLKLAGSYAYLAGEDPLLSILDVSVPASPRLLGTFQTNGFSFQEPARCILPLPGGYACLASETDFFILDVRNPLEPVQAGNPWQAREEGVAGVFSVVSRDRFVWMTAIFYRMDGLRVKETALLGTLNPARQTGWTSFPEWVGDPVFFGPHAYAVVQGGLRVYDVAVLPYFTSVAQTGGRLVMAWPGEPGLRLQRSVSLTRPDWTDVPGSEGQSSFQWPMTNGSGFFRLLRPPAEL